MVGGVAYDNGTSPPSPLLKERGDSPMVVLWLVGLPSKQFVCVADLVSTVIARL